MRKMWKGLVIQSSPNYGLNNARSTQGILGVIFMPEGLKLHGDTVKQLICETHVKL